MWETLTRRDRERLARDDLADYLPEADTVSGRECTGLFPTPPRGDAAYEGLRDWLNPGADRDGQAKGRERR